MVGQERKSLILLLQMHKDLFDQITSKNQLLVEILNCPVFYS